jgi:hypothetical protein
MGAGTLGSIVALIKTPNSRGIRTDYSSLFNREVHISTPSDYTNQGPGGGIGILEHYAIQVIIAAMWEILMAELCLREGNVDDRVYKPSPKMVDFVMRERINRGQSRRLS